MRTYATVFAILSFILLGVACSSEVDEGGGTLPIGIEDDLVPDVEYDLYMYFNADTPVVIERQRFLGTDQEEVLTLGGDDQVSITSVSMVATSLQQFGGILGFATSSDAALAGNLLAQRPVDDPPTTSQVATSTVRIIRGDAEWTTELSNQYGSAELVSLKERSPQAWNMLTNLPDLRRRAPDRGRVHLNRRQPDPGDSRQRRHRGAGPRHRVRHRPGGQRRVRHLQQTP